jgi:hypothetical protein
MPVREGVKAVTRAAMKVRLSEVKKRWPAGGRVRDDVEEARCDAEASDAADHRPSRWPSRRAVRG